MTDIIIHPLTISIAVAISLAATTEVKRYIKKEKSGHPIWDVIIRILEDITMNDGQSDSEV